MTLPKTQEELPKMLPNLPLPLSLGHLFRAQRAQTFHYLCSIVQVHIHTLKSRKISAENSGICVNDTSLFYGILHCFPERNGISPFNHAEIQGGHCSIFSYNQFVLNWWALWTVSWMVGFLYVNIFEWNLQPNRWSTAWRLLRHRSTNSIPLRFRIP